MTEFIYKARDKFGNIARGVTEAETSGAASANLKQMGYVPVSIRPKPRQIDLFGFIRRFQGVPLADLNIMTRQLVTLQRAGLPLITSLTVVQKQAHNLVLKTALSKVIAEIEAGKHLSEALAGQPGVFNDLYVNMIRAGETSGMLDDILERLAILGEGEEKTHAQVQAAIRYPIFCVCALIIGFIILTVLVIPRFSVVYSQFDVPLPFPTRVLILTNVIAHKYWGGILAVICGAAILFLKMIRTPRGRFWWDALKLKIPIFGPLANKIVMSRFARVTSILFRSGVPILETLKLISQGVGNVVIERLIAAIRASVNDGKTMSEPMEISGMFPPAVVQMVAAGEMTGRLDDLLLHVSDYYDFQIEYTVKNLTSLIEPLLVFMLSCGVLFMGLGIFLPMWNLMSLFR